MRLVLCCGVSFIIGAADSLMGKAGASRDLFDRAPLRYARISTPSSQNRARRGPRVFGRAEGVLPILTQHLPLQRASAPRAMLRFALRARSGLKPRPTHLMPRLRRWNLVGLRGVVFAVVVGL